jgi:hypothetical protein
LASPQVVEINEIQNQDSTEVIKIEGTVERIIPLLDRRAIEIKDTTGSILVVTDNKILPKVGDRIAVEGVLKSKEIILDDEVLNEYYLQQVMNTGE